MFKKLSNFKHSIRLGLGFGLGLGLGLGLGSVLGLGLGLRLGLLSCDIENNIWRHLLNILNDRIVEVLRFSVIILMRTTLFYATRISVHNSG